MSKILLVENDVRLGATLKQLLQIEYQVLHALTLQRAYELLQLHSFDLLIVDRGLDDGDGLELAAFMSEVSFSTKFIFLTQKGETEERLKGLQAGADDYLPKPFSLPELKLKVKKLLQMQKLPDVSYLEAGDLRLYPETGVLQLADHRRTIRRRESQILACLLRYQGSVVSRQMLVNDVWRSQTEVPSFTTLDVYIRRIRIVLGNSHSRMIKTVRGFGYQLVS